MRALYSAFFSGFGLPRQFHSDQGSNFQSKLVPELCSIAGINKTRTTPFHARSDGQTERANRTILQMLRASIDAQPESWPDRLPALLAAYRMTLHSVTGISPNMAMMGREVLLPASLIVQPPEEPVAVTTSFAAEFRQNMHNAHASVRSPTSRAAKTQKNYYDKHVKGPPFALNQLMWLYWPRPLMRTRSRKLTRSWSGPWRIVEFKTTIVVVVHNVKTNKKTDGSCAPLGPCRGFCTTRSKKLWFLRRLARVAASAAVPDCRTVTSLNTRQSYHVLGLSALPSPSNLTQIVSIQSVG